MARGCSGLLRRSTTKGLIDNEVEGCCRYRRSHGTLVMSMGDGERWILSSMRRGGSYRIRGESLSDGDACGAVVVRQSRKRCCGGATRVCRRTSETKMMEGKPWMGFLSGRSGEEDEQWERVNNRILIFFYFLLSFLFFDIFYPM